MYLQTSTRQDKEVASLFTITNIQYHSSHQLTWAELQKQLLSGVIEINLSISFASVISWFN
jgi:hypothetical protein